MTSSTPRCDSSQDESFSAVERAKYLHSAHGAQPPWASTMTDAEQKMRADRWRSMSIKERAERVPKFHYTVGYSFYSSIEHSAAVPSTNGARSIGGTTDVVMAVGVALPRPLSTPRRSP